MKKIFTFLLMLHVNYFAFCQWSTNPAINNAICTNFYNQNLMQITTDGSGGAIIAWIDNRDKGGLPSSIVYVQRINSNGNVQWTADGVRVTPAGGIDIAYSLTSDGNAGAIISWPYLNTIYAQRINQGGILQWGVSGVTICSTTGNRNYPKITGDGNGGGIIVWNDGRNNGGLNDDDLYTQRVNAAGDIQWAANGIPVVFAAGYQGDSQITADGNGGAIIVWEDSRIDTTIEIYTQKVSAAGTMQWPDNGVLVNSVTNGSLYPQLISEAGGAIICWADRRNGNTNWDIYAQKVNSVGVEQWTANGVGVCMATGSQSFPQLTSDGNGGAIITWDYPNSAGNPAPDIYAQRVNAGGAVQWAINGVGVCLAGSQQRLPQIVSDGNGGAVITWLDSRTNNIQDVYAQRINSGGIALWTIDGAVVSNANFIQTYPIVLNDGINGFIFTWIDFRNDLTAQRSDIYAQRLDSNGKPGGTVLPVTLLNFEGKKLNNKVQLQWQTTSEENSNYFSIERSNDGTRFAAIGKVNAAGYSNRTINYSFIDITPGSINFYRLRQFDKDGKFTYSRVIKIVNDVSEIIFTLSPNPSSNFISITYPGKKEMLTVSIYDAQGRMLKQQTQRNELPVKVEIRQLEPGMYFIRLMDGQIEYNGKFLKQ